MDIERIQNAVRCITLALTLIVFIVTAINFIITRFKKHHDKLTAEEENEQLSEKLDDSNNEYKLINEIIPLAMKKAEETPLIDGMTKKLLALSEILLQCSTCNIDFEKYKDFISEQIENLITFSKTINKREE